MRNKILDLGNEIYLIDGYDLEMPERTGAYLIKEHQTITIVETGPSMSIPHILNGLNELGVDPLDVTYIIVTHIHLDHAGGAGLLLNDCKNAKVVVHPRGARHLCDPTRLIQGAKAVYGKDFERLFDPIIPIPESRLLVMEDHETLTIGERKLTFYHLKGHADHHFCIHDSKSNGMFTGDTIGIQYTQCTDVELYLPSTSPNQFRPEEMRQSLHKIIKEYKVERIYFGHYSMSTNIDEVYTQISYWLPRFVEIGEAAFNRGDGHEQLQQDLLIDIKQWLTQKGMSENNPFYDILKLDLSICAMGIIDYLKKR